MFFKLKLDYFDNLIFYTIFATNLLLKNLDNPRKPLFNDYRSLDNKNIAISLHSMIDLKYTVISFLSLNFSIIFA